MRNITPMSENLNIRSTLTAVDEASPVLRKFLAEIRKIETTANRLNASFANFGRSGSQAFSSVDRAARNITAQIQGAANTARQASKDYATDWRRAMDRRVADASRAYARLEALERNYQRQLSRRASAGVNLGRAGVGGTGRIPTPRISTLTVGGAAIGASTASAIKKRIEVEAAEVRAQMFSELSKEDVLGLRKQTDKLGIMYGVGSTKAIDAATEGLKAGIQQQYAGQFAELALKAKVGLDLDEADTAKLMGRIATARGGFDYNSMSSILSAIAVANNATAADGKEIVEAYRRSLSALTATKMKPEDLAAFNAAGVSIGVQPFKMGTYMSFITSELANAKNARGQRADDLNKAANMLGFGGRFNLSTQMIANPTETLLKVYERLMQMPEGLRAKVANLIGQREWRDELLSVASARDLIVRTLSEIANKKGFLDATALKKIQSMGGRLATIQAAFGLAWEKTGSGFDKMFEQVSDAMISVADRFSFETIKDHFAALVDGAREGFGFKDWGEVVKSIADSLDSGPIKKWRDFGRGFASGIKEVADGFKFAFKALAFMFGGDKDAEGLGRFTAKLTAVAVALALLSPTLAALATFAGILTMIASTNSFVRLTVGLFALVAGIKRVLEFVSDKIFSVFVSIVDAVRSVALSFINRVRGWVGLAPINDVGSSGSSGGSSGATDFSGMRRQPVNFSSTATNLNESLRGNVPSFNGSGGAAGSLDKAAFERKFANTALAGKYGQIVAAAQANGIPPALLAGVIGHETGNGAVLSGNNPGGIMDRSTGWSKKMRFADLDSGIERTAEVVARNYRLAGHDIDKMGDRYAKVGAANDPRALNGGWPAGVRRQMLQLGGGDISGIKGGANFMKGQFGQAGSNLTTIALDSGKRVTVHKEAAESFRGFLNELEGSGYKIDSLGGYVMKNKFGGGGLSQHALWQRHRHQPSAQSLQP